MKPSEYLKEIKLAKKLVIGYNIFYDPKHPLANSCGWIYHHRHVVSLSIGRWLRSDEQVHHIDENKVNNVMSNLQVVTRKEHANIHNGERKKIECKACGKLTFNDHYCSVECNAKSQLKIDIPVDELRELVWTSPMTLLSADLGISDVAIKKKCKKNRIEVPPIGYWACRNNGYSHEKALVKLKETENYKPLPPKFTKDQLDLIIFELRKDDLSFRKIAKLVNCSHQSIMRIGVLLKVEKESEIYSFYKVEKYH